jgi:hypothetical protein
MSEFEELKLVVSLSDHASAGINNYQKSIASFSSGQSATQVESFKRQNSLIGTLLKSTGLEAGKTAEAFGELAARYVTGGATIAAFAGSVFASMTMVSAAAKQIAGQARELEKFGVDYAEGKNIIEQYEQVGMTAAEATQNIQAGVETAHEAHKNFQSKMFEDLKTQFGGVSGGERVVQEYKEALRGAKETREIMNANKEFQDRFGKLALENRTYETQELANQAESHNREIFRQITGFNDMFNVARQVTALDEERAKALKEMNDRAREFNDLWNATAVNLERIVDVFSSAAMGGGFILLLQSAHDLTKAIFQVTQEGMAAMKDKNFWRLLIGDDFFRPLTPQDPLAKRVLGDPLYRWLAPKRDYTPDYDATFRQFGPQPSGVQPFASLGGGGDENLDANTRELRRLNDNLYALLHPEAAAAARDAASAPIVIPGLARGGIIDRPTLALIGEKGPEAVVPLTQRAAPNLSFGGSSMTAHGGGINIAQGGAINMMAQGGNIRMMADGGVVTKPTLAMIGEAGAEAVVPLNKKLPIPQAYNNPGDIKWGQFAQEHGAIGRGARGGHAVFASAEEGQQALSELLEERGATGKSLSQINKWYAEDPRWGAGVAKKLGGVSRTQTLGSQGISSSDLAMAIAAQEGFRSVIDGAARSQEIEAGGHIKIQIGRQGAASRRSAALFKPVPEQALVQMVPTGVNPVETQRSTQPSLSAE